MATPAAEIPVPDSPSPIVSIAQLAVQTGEASYGELKAKLMKLGYTPLKGPDLRRFNMAVAGDAAECGNRSCQIPWSGQVLPTFCVAVTVNETIEESKWLSSVGDCD
jgi:hypothetical protein